MHPGISVLLVALLMVGTLPATAQPATTSNDRLAIAELLPAPDATAGQREFIELHNLGSHPVSLRGWRIEDAPTASGAVNGFTFGDEVLGAGARLVVWSNGSGDPRGPSWSTSATKTVWNDAGDAATLLTPAGEVADWLAYGNSVASAPAGFDNSTRPAAPAKGSSLARTSEGWVAGSPTPALAPGAQGGIAAATVENSPPSVSLTGPPRAKPSELVTLGVRVDDANGPGDLKSWAVRAAGAVVAAGNTTGNWTPAIRTPATSGSWVLELEAVDQAGASTKSNLTVQVRDARLVVEVPASGGIRFPALAPGQRNVTSLEPFLVTNDGFDAAPVLLDVSPFSGPGTIPVDGNLWVGVAAGNDTIAWSRYEHPLQALPSLAPGAVWSVWLRIDTVPSPLAAGKYGTSFTVVGG